MYLTRRRKVKASIDFVVSSAIVNITNILYLNCYVKDILHFLKSREFSNTSQTSCHPNSSSTLPGNVSRTKTRTRSKKRDSTILRTSKPKQATRKSRRVSVSLSLESARINYANRGSNRESDCSDSQFTWTIARHPLVSDSRV